MRSTRIRLALLVLSETEGCQESVRAMQTPCIDVYHSFKVISLLNGIYQGGKWDDKWEDTSKAKTTRMQQECQKCKSDQ